MTTLEEEYQNLINNIKSSYEEHHEKIELLLEEAQKLRKEAHDKECEATKIAENNEIMFKFSYSARYLSTKTYDKFIKIARSCPSVHQEVSLKSRFIEDIANICGFEPLDYNCAIGRGHISYWVSSTEECS